MYGSTDVTTKQIRAIRRRAARKSKGTSCKTSQVTAIGNFSVSRRSQCLDVGIESYSLQIKRPLAFLSTSVSYNQRAPVLGLAIQEGWTHSAICRLVSCGYSAESITNIIFSVPRSIKDAINQALLSLNDASKKSALSDQITLPCCMKVNATISLLLSEDKSLWLKDPNRSICALTFDSATQCSTGMFANSCIQHAFGMHTEEFLSRSAAYDLPLGMPDLDFLRLFLDIIISGVVRPRLVRVRYIRSIAGPRRSYVLILWCSVAVLGPDKRVIEVNRRIPPCSVTSTYLRECDRANKDNASEMEGRERGGGAVITEGAGGILNASGSAAAALL